MASVDAGQYSLSSDEKVEFECSPCKDDGIVQEATYFCPECLEYFCSSCESSLHGRLKATKSHKLISANDSTKSGPQKITLPIMKCGCNRDRSVEFVCDDHKYLVCSECKIIDHRKCKLVKIAEKSKSFYQSTIDLTLTQTTKLENKAKRLHNEQNETLKLFEASKVLCKKEVCRVRDQLTSLVEVLAAKVLDEIQDVPFEQSEELQSSSSTCTSVIEKLKFNQKLLQDAKGTMDIKQMFVADFFVRKHSKNYESLLEEIESEIKTTSLTFKPDTFLTDIHNKVKKLGEIIVVSQHTGRPSGKATFPGSLHSATVDKSEKFDITPDGAVRLTGSTCMPNGDLLVCDNNAQTLYVIDPEFKVKEAFKLPGKPWDVAVINDEEVILSYPSLKELQIVYIKSPLRLGSCIELSKKCFDVKVIKEIIYVACNNDPGEGEIIILDKKGRVKKRVGLNDDGSYFFNRPLHMAVNCAEDRIYVSDGSSQTVFCMSVEGQILSKFSYPQLKNPRGIMLDKENNFLVCGVGGIYLVTADGSTCTKFLRSIGNRPYCLSYKDTERKLVVIHEDKLLVFKCDY